VSATKQSAIADAEMLARFVMVRRWIRQDNTVRSDAFIPPPDLNLSVTRHGTLSEHELWQRGHRVAEQRDKPLYGRADVSAMHVRDANLDAIEYPLYENPEHAHITGWPTEKSAQKAAAQQLAASAQYVPA